MCKARFIFFFVATLLFALFFNKCELERTTILPLNELETEKTFFEPDEPIDILIPAIGLHTKLGFAPIIDGRLDPSELKKVPVLISPEAGSGLQKIGLPGVSLILGHRQWCFKPLVFARLDELSKGDVIFIFNKKAVIEYIVSGQAEIDPRLVWETIDKVSMESLRENISKLILVTCAPYGANFHRLLIFAGRKAGAGSGIESRGGYSRP